MKFRPKQTTFEISDIPLIIEFDRELERVITFQWALKSIQLKPLCLKDSFKVFLADFKAKRSN